MCLTANTIGPQGVQLFVDAGPPVSNSLVTSLVREVLIEKIAAMLGERADLVRGARGYQDSIRPSVSAAVDSASQPSRVSLWL